MRQRTSRSVWSAVVFTAAFKRVEIGHSALGNLRHPDRQRLMSFFAQEKAVLKPHSVQTLRDLPCVNELREASGVRSCLPPLSSALRLVIQLWATCAILTGNAS